MGVIKAYPKRKSQKSTSKNKKNGSKTLFDKPALFFCLQGTTVIPLLTSVLYDESEWESPHTFNPSHFLDKEGKFIRRDAFLPFSAGTTFVVVVYWLQRCFTQNDPIYRSANLIVLSGRRACLGESLAKMELFLFFTSLLQRFRFTPPPGVTEEELDLLPAVGFTLSPSPHELCAISRQ